MDEDIHQYAGEEIEVSYDVNRCIHARECVRGLPDVFDPDKHPWIEPDNANIDELTDVIMECPTGALHFDRADGGPDEPIPEKNTVTVAPDGPLYLRGGIEITTPDDDVLLRDTRVALCRCGLSENKPLCDNSHAEGSFEADGVDADQPSETIDELGGGTLTVTPTPDGPVLLRGDFELRRADDSSTFRDTDIALCRCGGSQNKPFCDGTHKELGFSSEN